MWDVSMYKAEKSFWLLCSSSFCGDLHFLCVHIWKKREQEREWTLKITSSALCVITLNPSSHFSLGHLSQSQIHIDTHSAPLHKSVRRCRSIGKNMILSRMDAYVHTCLHGWRNGCQTVTSACDTRSNNTFSDSKC